MIVWKSRISAIEQRVTVCIPDGSSFMAARTQGHDISIWYTVPDIYARLVMVEFIVVGTGKEIVLNDNETLYHWGTVQEEGYVLHIFQVLPGDGG